ANAAWLILAGIAHNLTRAAGCLASTFHALARPATIRDQLINIAARIATSARRITLHMPTRWRWEDPWRALITAVT
ncbi:MAG: family transposase, partial [Propionibacteriaceae bacterium]|nr:family transposase [Propionibacteriaceae bacterium]